MAFERSLILLGLLGLAMNAETVRLPGLKQPVEILRDRWGVPHVYAQNADDLFFANGYINARDRLFQLDLWRRIGTGKLAEAVGASAVERDRLARLFLFRGDWNAEWQSYSPDTRSILVAFTNGINAYIRSLNGNRPIEFRQAAYDPGLWTPEDCVARIAGLSITRNVAKEIARAQDVARFGLASVMRLEPIFPDVPLAPPPGVELSDVSNDIARALSLITSASPFGHGSNNWVVDGTRSVSGKPLLASDPHRDLLVPSFRRTIHLSAPGWNVIGAGEPALPGISLGHNDDIAFGFTITGVDQEDLYVEKLNPKKADEYWYHGAWKRIEIIHEKLPVKASAPRDIDLRFTIHGPVIYEDRAHARAYALRWVGNEPGGAGYLSMLASSRAKNWTEFRASLARFKVPSENMAYADRAGNIGFAVAGFAPVRKNWTGLLPVPGTGEFEWNGFVPPVEMPAELNPPRHWLATANNNILPAGYRHAIGYEWGPPFRVQRIAELLQEPKKFGVSDFERMQYDVVSIPARRFQNVVRKWKPGPGPRAAAVQLVLNWNASTDATSVPALICEVWMSKLPVALFTPSELAPKVQMEVLLSKLESLTNLSVLGDTLDETLAELTRYLGPDKSRWQWLRANNLTFLHPLNKPEWNRGPFARGGDSFTVDAAGGARAQSAGASYREVIDLSDWDKSTMTNVPGEVGDPTSPHYSDLLDDWLKGRYHPMPFSRKAVEAVTTERITLTP